MEEENLYVISYYARSQIDSSKEILQEDIVVLDDQEIKRSRQHILNDRFFHSCLIIDRNNLNIYGNYDGLGGNLTLNQPDLDLPNNNRSSISISGEDEFGLKAWAEAANLPFYSEKVKRWL